jgi:hypothetical protein
MAGGEARQGGVLTMAGGDESTRYFQMDNWVRLPSNCNEIHFT